VVNGLVTISGGNPGAGKVLTSDATGVASWQTPTGSGGGVTQITAGNGITINPTTGLGNVTVTNVSAGQSCTNGIMVGINIDGSVKCASFNQLLANIKCSSASQALNGFDSNGSPICVPLVSGGSGYQGSAQIPYRASTQYSPTGCTIYNGVVVPTDYTQIPCAGAVGLNSPMSCPSQLFSTSYLTCPASYHVIQLSSDTTYSTYQIWGRTGPMSFGCVPTTYPSMVNVVYTCAPN
jgi:hypothetical protein